MKRRVFDAALISSLVYGCESWLTSDLRPIIKLYNMGIKALLGVRTTTCNEMSYMELACVPLPALVRRHQRRFFRSMWEARRAMPDDPLIHAISVHQQHNNPVSRLIYDLLSNDTDDVAIARENLLHSLLTSSASPPSAYRW